MANLSEMIKANAGTYSTSSSKSTSSKNTNKVYTKTETSLASKIKSASGKYDNSKVSDTFKSSTPFQSTLGYSRDAFKDTDKYGILKQETEEEYDKRRKDDYDNAVKVLQQNNKDAGSTITRANGTYTQTYTKQEIDAAIKTLEDMGYSKREINAISTGSAKKAERYSPDTYKEVVQSVENAIAQEERNKYLSGLDVTTKEKELSALKEKEKAFVKANGDNHANTTASGNYVDTQYDPKKAEELTKLRTEIASLEKDINQAKEYQWDQGQLEKVKALDEKTLEAVDSGIDAYKNKDVSIKTNDLYGQQAYNEWLAKMEKLGYEKAEADEIVKYRIRQQNEEKDKEVAVYASELAKDKPVAAAAMARVSNLASGAGILDLTLQKLNQISPNSGYEPLDYHVAGNRLATFTRGVDSQNAEQIAKHSRILSEAYGIGMSMVDSAAVMAISATTGINAGFLLGGSAATQAAIDAHSRGVSDTQAVLTGVSAGIAESLFESLSLEKVLKASALQGIGKERLKILGKNIITQGITEASEEANTTIFNTVLDQFINGDLSDYSLSVLSYYNESGDLTDAVNKATTDFAKQLGQDALAGFISGIGMGSIGTAYSTITGRNLTVEQVINYASQVQQMGAVVNDGANNTELAKALESLNDKYMKGEKITQDEVADVYKLTYDTYKAKVNARKNANKTSTDASLSSVASTYTSIGASAKVARNMETTINNLVDGKNVVLGDVTKLQLDNETYRNAFTSLTGVEIPDGLWSSTRKQELLKFLKQNVKGVTLNTQTAKTEEQTKTEEQSGSKAEQSKATEATEATKEESKPQSQTKETSKEYNEFAQAYRETVDAEADEASIKQAYVQNQEETGNRTIRMVNPTTNMPYDVHEGTEFNRVARVIMANKSQNFTDEQLATIFDSEYAKQNPNSKTAKRLTEEATKKEDKLKKSLDQLTKKINESASKQGFGFTTKVSYDAEDFPDSQAQAFIINGKEILFNGNKIDSEGALMYTLGHEVTHDAAARESGIIDEVYSTFDKLLEAGKLTGKIKDLVKNKDKSIKDIYDKYQRFYKRQAEREGIAYKESSFTIDDAKEEFAADLMREAITHTKLYKDVIEESPTIASALKRAIDKMKQILKNEDGIIQDEVSAKLLDDLGSKLEDALKKEKSDTADTKKRPSLDSGTETYTRKQLDDGYKQLIELRDKIQSMRKDMPRIEDDAKFNEIMGKVMATDRRDPNFKSIMEEYRNYVNEFEETTGKAKLDELQSQYSELNKKVDEIRSYLDFEDEKIAVEKSGLTEAEYFIKKAKKTYKTTTRFSEAGYMTPDGKLLDFSDGMPGQRGQDHRNIGQIFAIESGTKALTRFMNLGNVRIMAESPGIDISTANYPTDAQYNAIKKFVQEYAKKKDGFYVDISDETGRVTETLEYNGSITGDQVVNDIKSYLKNGQKPQRSTTAQFHKQYSLDNYDSFGIRLSENTKEYFKNTKIVDYDGKLTVMYHGTPSFGFTVFDGPYHFFTDNPDVAGTYTESVGLGFKSGINIAVSKGTDFSKLTMDIEDYEDAVKYFGNRVVDVTDESREYDLDESTYMLRLSINGLNDCIKAAQEAGIEWLDTEHSKLIQSLDRLTKVTDNIEYATGVYHLYSRISDFSLDFDVNSRWYRDDYISSVEDYDDLMTDIGDSAAGIARMRPDIKALANSFYSKDLVKYLYNVIPRDSLIEYAQEDQEIARCGIYAVHLKVENPFVIDCKGNSWNELDYIYLSDAYENYKPWEGTDTRSIVEWVQEQGEYDGVVFKNIYDMGDPAHADIDRMESNVVITFESNQAKAVMNDFPTSDPDIRYSIADDEAPLTEQQLSNIAINNAVSSDNYGAKLITLSPSKSAIERYKKTGVGKYVGNQLYFHKNYVQDISSIGLSMTDFNEAEKVVKDLFPDFTYNTLMFEEDKKTGKRQLRFDEAPDFDVASEPIPGKMVKIDLTTMQPVKFTKGMVEGTNGFMSENHQIWHHKWNWVKNDYTGFDVKQSWEHSREWLNVLRATDNKLSNRGIANGSTDGAIGWKKQLDYFGIEMDPLNYLAPKDRVVRYSLSDTVPTVEQKSTDWYKTYTSEDLRRAGLKLFSGTEKEEKLYDKEGHEIEKNHPTQVLDTIESYKAYYDILEKNYPDTWKDLSVLDASSGLGHGTQEGRNRGFNVDDLEPYAAVSKDDNGNTVPKIVRDSKTKELRSAYRTTEGQPMYESYPERIASGKQYDVVISNAVLNVLPQDLRDEILSSLDKLTKVGGEIFINVRSKSDVAGYFKKHPGSTQLTNNTEWFVNKTGAYQKGFTDKEFQAYLKDAFGSRYVIETAKKTDGNTFRATVVHLTKNAEADIKYSLIEAFTIGQTAAGMISMGLDQLEAGMPYLFTKDNSGFNGKGLMSVDEFADEFDRYMHRLKGWRSKNGTELTDALADILDKAVQTNKRLGVDFIYSYAGDTSAIGMLKSLVNSAIMNSIDPQNYDSLNTEQKMSVDKLRGSFDKLLKANAFKKNESFQDFVSSLIEPKARGRYEMYDADIANNLLRDSLGLKPKYKLGDTSLLKDATRALTNLLDYTGASLEDNSTMRYSLSDENPSIEDFIAKYDEEHGAGAADALFKDAEQKRRAMERQREREARIAEGEKADGTRKYMTKQEMTTAWLIANKAALREQQRLHKEAMTEQRKKDAQAMREALSKQKTRYEDLLKAEKIEHHEDVKELNSKLNKAEKAQARAEKRLQVTKESINERLKKQKTKLSEKAKENAKLRTAAGRTALNDKYRTEKKRQEIEAEQGPIDTIRKMPEEMSRMERIKNAGEELRTKGRSLYRAFVSDVKELEDFAKLQVSNLRVDHLTSVLRASNETSSLIFNKGLVDRYGNIIGDSLADVILCYDENGVRVDPKKQAAFQDYLMHKHNVDRMSIESKALEKLNRFEANNMWLSEVSPSDLAKLVATDDEDLPDNRLSEKRVALDYLDVLEAYNNAKNKPIFADKNGVPVTAKSSQQIVDTYEQENPWMKDKADAYYAWWDDFMTNWVVGDSITQSQYESMKEMYPHYVPTYRKMYDGKGKNGVSNTGKSIASAELVKTAVGSTSELVDFEDSLQMLISKGIKSARANELLLNLIDTAMLDEDGLYSGYIQFDWAGFTDGSQTLYDDGELLGWNEHTADAAEHMEGEDKLSAVKTKDGYVIRAWYNGDRVAAYVSEDMFNAISAASGKTQDRLANLTRLGNKLTAPMKTAITGINPNFAVRNVMRDLPTAIINSESGLQFPKYVGLALRDMWEAGIVDGNLAGKIASAIGTDINAIEEKGNAARWNAFVSLGGTHSEYFNNEGGFVQSIATSREGSIASRIKNQNVAGAVSNAQNVAKMPIKALSSINEITEAMTRYAEFIATLDREGDTYQNRLRAIRNSAEVTVDFGRHGSYGQFINAWVPYWNPAVQGIDKVVRSVFETKEGETLLKHAGKTLGKAGMTTVLFEAVLYAVLKASGRYDDWEELTDRMKDTYYCIPIGDEHEFLKIPKNREWGAILGTPIMRMLEAANGRENPFENYIETSFEPNFLPGAILRYNFREKTIESDVIGVSQALDLANNKDFAGRTIIPYNYQSSRANAVDQWNEDTSVITREIGQLLKFSPMQADYIIGDYFGDFGSMFTKFTSESSIKAMKEDGISSVTKEIGKTLTSPWLGDNRYSNQDVSDYYNAIDQLQKDYQGEKLHGTGDAKDSPAYDIYTAVNTKYGKQITELNKEVKNLPDGEEKDNIKAEIAQLAHDAMAFINDCESGAITNPTLTVSYENFSGALSNELIRLDPMSEDYSFKPTSYKPTSYVDPNNKGYKYELDSEAQTKYTEFYQQNYNELMSAAINSAKYKAMSDKDKAKYLEEVRDNVTSETKEDILAWLAKNKKSVPKDK